MTKKCPKCQHIYEESEQHVCSTSDLISRKLINAAAKVNELDLDRDDSGNVPIQTCLALQSQKCFHCKNTIEKNDVVFEYKSKPYCSLECVKGITNPYLEMLTDVPNGECFNCGDTINHGDSIYTHKYANGNQEIYCSPSCHKTKHH